MILKDELQAKIDEDETISDLHTYARLKGEKEYSAVHEYVIDVGGKPIRVTYATAKGAKDEIPASLTPVEVVK